MPDPYELDDEGNPIAEVESATEDAPTADGPVDETPEVAAPDAAGAEEQEALRRQVEQTLRFMRLQTAVGFVVLLVLIVVLSDIRGVMVLVTIVFLLTSVAAYAFLRRTLNNRVLGR